MNPNRSNTTRWRAVPLATLLLLAACADAPSDDGNIRLTGRERAEQVGRDVGAMVQGMHHVRGPE